MIVCCWGGGVRLRIIKQEGLLTEVDHLISSTQLTGEAKGFVF